MWIIGLTREQKFASYSRESCWVNDGRLGPSTAVERIHARRTSYASAKPKSAIHLGQGSSFFYSDGVLSYVHGETVRILNVHEGSKTEAVIDLPKLLSQAQIHRDFEQTTYTVEILHYQDEKICLLFAHARMSLLMIIDVCIAETHTPAQTGRLLFLLPGTGLGSVIRGQHPGVKVTFTDELLYYLSNHESPSFNFRRWEIHVRAFDESSTSNSGMNDRVLPWFGNLFRNWPGHQIVMKEYCGNIFILSNRSFIGRADGDDQILTVQEEDSYYQCYVFPAGSTEVYSTEDPVYPLPKGLNMVRIFRDQPKASRTGYSLWPNLTLQEDESTGDLVIVESRRDVKRSQNDKTGKYFFQPLYFPNDDIEPLEPAYTCSIAGNAVGMCFHTVRDDDRVRGNPEHCYPLFDRREGLKYRSYNLSCNSSLAVVLLDESNEEVGGCNGQPNQRGQRVKFHIDSRTHAPPNYKPTTSTRNAEQEFIDKDRAIWPPINAPSALWELLNPVQSQTCDLRAQSDERSIVHLIGPLAPKTSWKPSSNHMGLYDPLYPRSDLEQAGQNVPPALKGITCDTYHEGIFKDGHEFESWKTQAAKAYDDSQEENVLDELWGDNAIVLVNFDEGIRFDGLETMHLGPNTSEDGDSAEALAERLAREHLQQEGRGKGKAVQVEDEPEANVKRSEGLFRIEPAMWLSIGKGFEFKYH